MLSGGRQGRSKSNRKVPPSVPLRRSARKAKCLIVQTKKPGGRRKGKQVKSRKGTCKKPKRGTSCLKKKRTQVYYSYWLNGLLLSRKPNDDRVMLFREKRFLVPSEQSTIPDQPKCQLCCEAGYTATLSYIACEICGGNHFLLLFIN